MRLREETERRRQLESFTQVERTRVERIWRYGRRRKRSKYARAEEEIYINRLKRDRIRKKRKQVRESEREKEREK